MAPTCLATSPPAQEPASGLRSLPSRSTLSAASSAIASRTRRSFSTARLVLFLRSTRTC
eukprot:SM006807S20511  [mRNA]  locus=s6807:160:655:- [translate_table: standard]